MMAKPQYYPDSTLSSTLVDNNTLSQSAPRNGASVLHSHHQRAVPQSYDRDADSRTSQIATSNHNIVSHDANTAGNKSTKRQQDKMPFLRPLLLAVAIFLVMAGLAATILALATSFKTAISGGTWYLSGVKGSLFLLLGSLSTLSGCILTLAVRDLSLYMSAWRTVQWQDGRARRRSIPNNSSQFLRDKKILTLKPHPSLLVVMMPVSCGVLIAIVLAGLIWLHISIKVNNITGPRSGNQQSRLLGRALSSECSQAAPTRDSFQLTFNSNFCWSRQDLVMNDTEGRQTAAGTSSSNAVLTIPKAYHGSDVAVLADPDATSGKTFTANTLGISTTCSPRYQPCQANVDDGSFNCSEPPFSGMITQPLALSATTAYSSGTSFDAAILLRGRNGAYKFQNAPKSLSVSQDGKTVLSILSCRTTALQVTCFSQGGALTAPSIRSADERTSKLLLSPLFAAQVSGYDAFGWDIIVSDVTKAAAAVAGSPQNPQSLANSVAIAFSPIAIASAAGVMEPSSSKAGGSSSTTLLPIAPTLIIVVADLVYALMGLLLGIFATVKLLRDDRIKDAYRYLKHGRTASATDTSGQYGALPTSPEAANNASTIDENTRSQPIEHAEEDKELHAGERYKNGSMRSRNGKAADMPGLRSDSMIAKSEY